jgi:hypothetical protein
MSARGCSAFRRRVPHREVFHLCRSYSRRPAGAPGAPVVNQSRKWSPGLQQGLHFHVWQVIEGADCCRRQNYPVRRAWGDCRCASRNYARRSHLGHDCQNPAEDRPRMVHDRVRRKRAGSQCAEQPPQGAVAWQQASPGAGRNADRRPARSLAMALGVPRHPGQGENRPHPGETRRLHAEVVCRPAARIAGRPLGEILATRDVPRHCDRDGNRLRQPGAVVGFRIAARHGLPRLGAQSAG